MTENSFNELELLSQEDLIVETLRKLLRAYGEIIRRDDIFKNFLKSLCSLSPVTWVWYILWESGGAQRYTDILRVVGGSKGTLSDILEELLRKGLVRRVGVLYQEVSPDLLVHISEQKIVRSSEPNQRKL